MAFWVIAAVVASTAATVGTTIYNGIEQKKQTDRTIKSQEENTRVNAYIEYGQALASAPGAIRV
jgi:hypothetical protein